MAQHWKDAVSNLEQIIGLVSFSQIPPPQVFLHFQFSKACDISSNLSGLDLRPTQYIYPICLNHLLVRAGRDILRFRLVGLFSGWAVKYNPSEQIHSEISPSTRLVFSSSPWQAQDSSEASIVHLFCFCISEYPITVPLGCMFGVDFYLFSNNCLDFCLYLYLFPVSCICISK